MMYSVIDVSDSRLALDGITDKLMDLFRKDQNLIDALLPELTGEEAPATGASAYAHERILINR